MRNQMIFCRIVFAMVLTTLLISGCQSSPPPVESQDHPSDYKPQVGHDIMGGYPGDFDKDAFMHDSFTP